jgi:hypothetical protein
MLSLSPTSRTQHDFLISDSKDYQCLSRADHVSLTPCRLLLLSHTSNDTRMRTLNRIQGYFSPKRAGYFIWESGYFREGSVVELGSSGRLAEVLEVGGVGKNYYMMKLKDLESLEVGNTATRGLVVSCRPTNIRFSLAQRLKMRFFKLFLKSLRDFADEKKVFNKEI